MSDEFLMDNPRAERVKKVAQLASRAGRRKQGLFLAEGPQPAQEALALWLRRWEGDSLSEAAPHPTASSAQGRSEQHIRAVCAPEGYLPALDALYFSAEALEQHPALESLLDRVRGVLFDPARRLPREARFFLREATEEVLDAMGAAETSQGVIAVCRPALIEFEGLDSLLVGMSETTVRVSPEGSASTGPTVSHPPVSLAPVLCGVQDPGNVGTLIRAADAAGAGVVVLTPGSADPWAPKVVRSAAGSHFHVPIAVGIDLAQLAGFVRDNGAQVLAAHGYAELSLDVLQADDAELARPTYWLLGSEAHGLSAQQRASADRAVSIPLYGQAESLNVAVAGALCLYASAIAQHRRPGLPAEPPDAALESGTGFAPLHSHHEDQP